VDQKDNQKDVQKQQSFGYKRYGNRRKRYHRRPGKTSQTERAKSSFKKISLVIPLFNEEESVIPLSHEIRKALSRVNIDYEVILIDDGSTDASLKNLKEITRTDNRFKYLSFRKNYGKSAALYEGFKVASGDVVITLDADLQDDPHEIHNLLKKLEEGYDLCSGWKKKRQDPFIKKISSKFFNFVTRLISGVKIHDFNCGLKAYRKEVVENVKVYGELHRYIPVLASWQGFKVTELIVNHHPRRYGKTKFGVSRFFKGFVDLITVIFVTRYIKRPMHFFGFLGAVSFLIGFVILGYLTILWIQGLPLSNRPIIFLGMLLIIVGLQLFAVGLLGEVIVFNSVSEREYVIKDKS
jgi:glycosyltransferase involved in cell wall biosynthesis